MRTLWLVAALVVVVVLVMLPMTHCGCVTRSDVPIPLSSFVGVPALPPPGMYYAFSEQRTPLYLCTSMWELASGIDVVDSVSATDGPGCASGSLDLPDFLKSLGDQQFNTLWGYITSASGSVAEGDDGSSSSQPSECIDVESWPVEDDWGMLTWALVRWRKSGDLNSPPDWDDTAAGSFNWALYPSVYDLSQIFFPDVYFPSDPYDYTCIFDGPPEEYFWFYKPLFGDCLWVDNSTFTPIAGWLPLSESVQFSQSPDLFSQACMYIPQPSRLRGESTTFLLRVCDGIVQWPEEWNWVDTDQDPITTSARNEQFDINFPTNFSEELQQFTRQHSGEQGVDIDGASVFLTPRECANSFTRQHSGEQGVDIDGASVFLTPRECANSVSESKLPDVVQFLAEYYSELGIHTWSQSIPWEDKSFTNLIGVIPGQSADAAKYPVVITDHYDAAWCENIYGENGTLIATDGADDNASASAALMMLAKVLSAGIKFERDIWISHLVGEEFPADCLGIRSLVSLMLQKKQDATAIIVLDMIGYNSDDTFQVNPGDSEKSLAIADAIQDAAAREASSLTLLVQKRWYSTSYLYNTDGIAASLAGYPVALVNEHINYEYDFWRQGYHDNYDTCSLIDPDYHAAIARTVTAAALSLASQPL
ncbi:Zn-dependent exopeptidase M28 [Pelomyxa schiedti]|nr:Zn-dependent exopeptidase M28 [Pelomyxa schiedti]